MLPAVTRAATVAITALGLAAATVAPAQALGKNERNFLKGVAAAVIVNEIVKQSRSHAGPQGYDPRYGHGRYQDTRPDQRHDNRHDNRYDNRYDDRYDNRYDDRYDDRYRHDRQRPGHSQGYQSNAAYSAFYEYSTQSRRLIQQRLAAYGYYRGAIDGVWGQGTAAAVAAYARDVKSSSSLATRDGSVRLYNALIG